MTRTSKTVYEIADDLTGEKIEEADALTVRLSYKGKSYALDLSAASAEKLDKALAPFLKNAKPVTSGGQKASSIDRKAVRAWAAENGHSVAERGVIPKAILEAYAAAH